MSAADPQLQQLLQAAATALQQGQFDRAAETAARVLSARPGDYDAMQIRALSGIYAGRGAQALPEAEALVRSFPDDAYARNTHGAALQVLRRMDEAAEAYRHAARLAPQWPDAWLNLGIALSEAGRHAEAVAAFRQANAIAPSHPRVLANLGTSLLHLGEDEEAIPWLRDALALEPANAAVATNLALARDRVGTKLIEGEGVLFPQATAAYARLAASDAANPRWRFLQALAFPPVLESHEQGATRMAEAAAQFAALAAEKPRLDDPYRQVGRTPFYFAYAGLDDTALQGAIADAFRACCPALEGIAPHVARRKHPNGRIRIGICSAHLRDHTIGKLNVGFVQHLDRRLFEVIVMRPEAPAETLSQLIDAAADRVVTLPAETARAREKIAALELDALFYPDIGMEPYTYFLAFARLAPLQFTTWGHPVTTGIPNIDVFLSTHRAEPAQAQRFYREKLVCLDALPSYYHPPRAPTPGDIRARLGIPAGARVYACPQTLFKFHPDQDAPLMEILRRDRDARLVLIASRQPAWNERLRARLAAAGPDVIDRVMFVASLPLPDFFALVRDADAMLDTFHFGGGNSSYEALALARPVVTLPAATMRGRITAAWYDVLEERRWIARDAADYVDRALHLAHDAADREGSRRDIAERRGRLLGNAAVVRELEQFIADALRERRAVS